MNPLLLLILGCPPFQTAPGEPPGPIERLLLEPEVETVAELQTRTEVAAAADDPLAGFVEHPGVRPRLLDGDPFLVLAGQGPRSLNLAGNFDTDRFNLVAVRLLTTEPAGLRLRLFEDDALVTSTEVVQVDALPAPQWVEFVLPATPSTVVTRLEAHLVHGPRRVAISDLELRERPLGTAQSLEAGSWWLSLEREGRVGVPLSAGTPLEATFTAEAGSSLSFSHAVPLRGDWTGQRLRLQILHGGRVRLNRKFELAPGAPGSWSFQRIPLGDLTGEARVEFALEADDGASPLPVCFLGEPRVVAPRPGARTVLLVTSDTHRVDHVAAMPRSVDVATPVLDALAARGIRFDNCLSTTNVTNPSHMAIMTARHPRDVGIADNEVPLSLAAPTLAESFAQAGWVTLACVSAPHLFHDLSGLGQGFDRMSGGDMADRHYRQAGRTVDVLLEWLEELEEEPVFVWLHLFDAHRPYDEDSPFRGHYYPPDRDPTDPAHDPGTGATALPHDLRHVLDLEFPRALYRAEVSYLDGELGRLLERSRLDDGVIAVTADHGESLGQHGIFFGHAGLYPDTVHVPLILTYPGCVAGQVRTDPVSHLQVARTLLALAGVDAVFPGADLREETDGPRFVLSSHHTEAAVYAGKWLLILHLTDHHEAIRLHGNRRHQVELYHLGEDPDCLADRSSEELRVARGLRASLLRWLAGRQVLDWTGARTLTATERQSLAELGYTGGTSPGLDELPVDPECTCPECARFR